MGYQRLRVLGMRTTALGREQLITAVRSEPRAGARACMQA
jgi:hypothetical protein